MVSLDTAARGTVSAGHGTDFYPLLAFYHALLAVVGLVCTVG